MPSGPAPVQPCGTPAAYRRHQRHGETCDTCRAASRRASADRRRAAGATELRTVVFDGRAIRNGIPEINYAWRARAYPWAERAIAAAEAEHGVPEDCDLDDLDYLLRSGYAREVAS